MSLTDIAEKHFLNINKFSVLQNPEDQALLPLFRVEWDAAWTSKGIYKEPVSEGGQESNITPFCQIRMKKLVMCQHGGLD